MPACLVVDVAVREDGVEVFDALLGAPVVVVLKALKGRRVKKYPQWYNYKYTIRRIRKDKVLAGVFTKQQILAYIYVFYIYNKKTTKRGYFFLLVFITKISHTK